MSDRQRWDDRYANAGPPKDPHPYLPHVAHVLPRDGRALDVAGGRGRHGLYLAELGMRSTIIDVSPVALAQAHKHAASRGVTVRTQAVDLQHAPLPPGPWNAITLVHYLQRPLLPHLVRALAPGGVLIIVQYTTTNLERNHRPSPRFLMRPGELVPYLRGLELLHCTESWWHDRHETRVVAQRPAHP